MIAQNPYIWTTDLVEELRRLRANGCTKQECARALGKTVSSVDNACQRYLTPGRPWPDIPPEILRAAILAEWRESVGSIADGLGDPAFSGGDDHYHHRIRDLAKAIRAEAA